MARKLRMEYPGANYHVMNRGAGRYKALVVEGSGNGYLRTVCDHVRLDPVRAARLNADVPQESFRTTMPLAWIAERLGMGSRGHLAWLQQEPKRRAHCPHRPNAPGNMAISLTDPFFVSERGPR